MQRERKLAALRRALRDDGYVKGDEASFYCPSKQGCNGQHHKRKLAVNVETDMFHCWVCGYKGGSLLPLLRRLGDHDEDYIDYAAEHAKRTEPVAAGKVYQTPKLPSEFRPLHVPRRSPYYSQAIAYLAQRGVTSDDILTYKLGYCEEGRYAERIIFPSFDSFGELNFMVGRAIWSRLGLPYLSGEYDKDIIFNDLLIDWKKPITLVEGPFDSIKAGPNAIALQGKIPSKKLMSKILSYMPKVYIALDSDATAEALKLATYFVNNGVETHMIQWPDGMKDPGELSRSEFERIRSMAPRLTASEVLKQQVYHSSSMGAV